MLAGAIRASLDLGDDRRNARDLGVADDARAELGVDDAEVRAPRRAEAARLRSRSASRADVPLPHGERSTSPSANTVTLRCVNGLSSSCLPEDDAVDVAQLGLERMDDVLPRLELALELPPELDEPRQLAGLDALLDATRRTRRRTRRRRSGRRARPPRPRRTPARCGSARSDAAVPDARPGVETTGRHVDDDVVLALLARDDALVERPGDERDRPVSARGRVARVVEEDDAEIGVVVVRLDDEAAVHVGVAARLVDEQPPHVVEPLERVAPLVEDRRALRRLDAARDDPERLARRVVVDRR